MAQLRILVLWWLLVATASAQISMDMPDVRREYAVRMAAWKAGYRVELGQPVEGRVGVLMRHVSLDGAMHGLLKGRATYRLLPVGSGGEPADVRAS